MNRKVCILMGSPHKNGNTAALLKPFTESLSTAGCACETVFLYDKNISPCVACRSCQQTWDSFGCAIRDDIQDIAKKILAADLIILATPVYSWYCTPPMKALLDRLVYGMNKYYGDKKGPSLWKGKSLALITTCGYPIEKGADLLEAGIRRYCRHSGLNYLGMLAERHLGYDIPFMNREKEQHARTFAENILKQQEI